MPGVGRVGWRNAGRPATSSERAGPAVACFTAPEILLATALPCPACTRADAEPNSGDFTTEGLISRMKAMALDNIHTTVIGELRDREREC